MSTDNSRTQSTGGEQSRLMTHLLIAMDAAIERQHELAKLVHQVAAAPATEVTDWQATLLHNLSVHIDAGESAALSIRAAAAQSGHE